MLVVLHWTCSARHEPSKICGRPRLTPSKSAPTFAVEIGTSASRRSSVSPKLPAVPDEAEQVSDSTLRTPVSPAWSVNGTICPTVSALAGCV